MAVAELYPGLGGPASERLCEDEGIAGFVLGCVIPAHDEMTHGRECRFDLDDFVSADDSPVNAVITHDFCQFLRGFERSEERRVGKERRNTSARQYVIQNVRA